MTTRNDLVDEVLLNLGGFDAPNEVVGTLTAAITSTTATQFVVTGATYSGGDPYTSGGFSPGLTEIGDELVYVTNVNRANGQLTVIRGWRGSTATTHAAGTVVRNLPTFPRHVVTKAINDTIEALPPRVNAIDTVEFDSTVSGPTVQDLEDVTGVLSVRYEVSWGDATEWVPSRRWRFDANHDGGGRLTVLDTPANVNIEATVTKQPVTLASVSSQFTSTLLPSWCKDLVVIGACWRVASFSGLGKLQGTSAEQSVMNVAGQVTPQVQTAQSAAKYFLGMFEKRLTECEERFQDTYPAQKHYVN